MLFNPEADKTIEEILEIAWTKLTPEMQARVLAEATAVDTTVGYAMAKAMIWFHDQLKDPLIQQSVEAKLDFLNRPFGCDPRLRKPGA